MGVSSFAVLPDVGPAATLALVLAALAPCLVRLWRAPDPAGFVHAASYAAMCRYSVRRSLPAGSCAIECVAACTSCTSCTVYQHAG